MRVAGCPILVVDDDPDVRETLAVVLEDEGFEVRCADNGAQALAALMHGQPRPRAVVLDLMMPVMSGWEVIDAVRADPELANVPIIALSAIRAPEGVTALTKPVSVGDLVQALDRVCRR